MEYPYHQLLLIKFVVAIKIINQVNLTTDKTAKTNKGFQSGYNHSDLLHETSFSVQVDVIMKKYR